MSPLFSYHGGHSGQYCRHAKGALRAVVERACELGFSTYGLAEHCPRLRTMDLFPGEEDLGPEGLVAQFEGYMAEARRLQAEFASRIELLVGFESEVIPANGWREHTASLRRVYHADFIIGSAHTVFERPIDLKPELTEELAEQAGGWDALCIAYFEQVVQVATELRPEVLGHLDLIRRFKGHDVEFVPNVWRAIERALEAARAQGALLEVNAAPVRRGFGPVYPGPTILARACQMDIPVTLGDDSHGPQDVGGGLDACLEAIAAAGYSRVHYLTREGGAVATKSAEVESVYRRLQR